MATVTKDLGGVTAYAAAVAGGFTGTQEEFEAQMAHGMLPVDGAGTKLFYSDAALGFDSEDGVYVGYTPVPWDYPFVEGGTYTVLWDGTEYTCTVVVGLNDMLQLGNWSIIDDEQEDTGEPFLFCNWYDYAFLTVDDSASHSVALIQHVATGTILVWDGTSWVSKGTGLPTWVQDGTGLAATAEGDSTTASGYGSHAEGSGTTASGHRSHAEGSGTTASRYGSHAEGDSTTASGDSSHAEGYNTTASGHRSHAEGYFTTAASANQHVQGKYNVVDNSSLYAHIVGGGTSSNARKNIHTLDWAGNAMFAGTLTCATSLTIGTTKITETQLRSLLALL